MHCCQEFYETKYSMNLCKLSAKKFGMNVAKNRQSKCFFHEMDPQLSYVRGESRFSDHRPVYSMFLAEVESISRNRIKKCSSCSSSRIEVEELLPHSHGYSYTDLSFF